MRSCRKGKRIPLSSDTPEQPNRKCRDHWLVPQSPLGQLVAADVAHNQTRVITDVLWIPIGSEESEKRVSPSDSVSSAAQTDLYR